MDTRFKETKIGRIPQEWTFAKLSEVVELRHGYQFRDYDFTKSGIAVVKIGNLIDGNLYLNDATFIDANRLSDFDNYVVRNGDLLMSLTGNIGRVVEVKGLETPVLQNYRVGRFSPRGNKMIKRYLKYALSSELLTKQINKFANQTAQANFGKKDLDKLSLFYPVPLPEQRKIAEILSTVDEAIEKTDAIINKTRQLKKGLMQKLFTEGIGHTRFKETRIGRIPEEWEIKPLGELGDFFKGTSIGANEIVEKGIPCIRYGDIYVEYENDSYVTRFSAFISEDTAKHSRKIETGDILFAGTGETQEDIGKCVAYTRGEEAYAGGDLIVFRPRKEYQLNSLFLAYCLNCGDVRKAKIRLGQGLSIFHIYSKHLKIVDVPIPLVSEQNKITEILSELDTKIETEQAFKSELEQLKKGLMQVLLTGKVRVKV